MLAKPSLLALPLELLEDIATRCTLSELPSLARVNRTFHKVSSRLLYRSIDLQPTSKFKSDSTPKLHSSHHSRASGSGKWIRCLQTLSRNNSSVASHIQSFKLSFPFSQCAYPTASFHRLLRGALLNMTRLTNLTLELPYQGFGDLSKLLAGAPFTLHRLQTPLPLTEPLIELLHTEQNGIREFCLRGVSSLGTSADQLFTEFSPAFHWWHPGSIEPKKTSADLPETFLPNLTSFSAFPCCTDLLHQLLPNRPIRKAILPLSQGTAEELEQTLCLLSQTRNGADNFSDLALMVYQSIVDPFSILGSIAKWLPGVESLQIVLILDTVSNDILSASTPAFSSFKKLRFLTIMSGASDDDEGTEEEAREVAKGWHELCPSLRTVILPKGLVWFKNDGDVATTPY